MMIAISFILGVKNWSLNYIHDNNENGNVLLHFTSRSGEYMVSGAVGAAAERTNMGKYGMKSQHFSNSYSPFYRPQRSWGKLMFLHLSVVLSTRGEVCHTHPGQTRPWAVHAGIWSTSGWYTSYWNAILLCEFFLHLATSNTLQKFQWFLPYLRGFTMVVYEKILFEAYTNDQYIGTKIILHKYILFYGKPSYVGIFPVDLGMSLIFTDFQ